MEKLTDFHSHILPAVDDGSDSVPTSLRLLEQSAAQGVGHLYATPHFYAHRDSQEGFLQRRSRAEELLREAAAGREDLPTFDVGAEVFYFRGMSGSDALENLTLGDTPYILVEMPCEAWTEDMYRELERIHDRQGLIPVIAHVERYFGTLSTHRIPEKLARMPVLVQSNASFFLNRRTSSRALRLLKQGYIHLLGSDCHSPDRRPPNLGDALRLIEKQLGKSALDMLQENAARVLEYSRTEE